MNLFRAYFFLLFVVVFSCEKSSKLEQDISKIEVDVQVERFDLAFKNSKLKDLPKLKRDFPFIISSRVSDSIYLKVMNDTLQKELLSEVEQTFPDFDEQILQLRSLFQHIKYYKPMFKAPRVVTLTNDVDYRSKTLVTDSIALIALDCFLGKEHYMYQNLPKYIATNLTKDQIVTDLAERYAEQFVFQQQRRTFLEDMIYFGKLLYFKDLMIPFKSDANKIGYAPEELAWAEANEVQIWSYFIEKELLYSTDPKLANRFLSVAPFSKFYKAIDNESPGRIGQFLGWQIVRSYAENNDTSSMDILKLDPQILFEKSYYKPKR